MSDELVEITAEGDWTADVEEEEGVVVDWFVREGTSVDEGDTLCEVQVEKVSADILAPVAGTVAEIHVGEDDEFTIGDTLAHLEPE